MVGWLTGLAALKAGGKLQAARPSEHTVSRGDTLSIIANRYGISVSSLRDANNLRSDNIQLGQTLKVPAGSMLVQNEP